MLNPFGYLLVVIFFIIALKCNTIYKIFNALLTLELFFALNRLNCGYFIHLAGSEIQYDDVVLGFLFIISIMIIMRVGKLNNRTARMSFLLLAIMVTGMAALIILPSTAQVVNFNHSWDKYVRGFIYEMSPASFSMQSILMSIRVVIFLTILNAAKVTLKKENWVDIGDNVFKYSRIVYIYCFFEAICKKIFSININNIVVYFFGRGISTGGGLRLQGLSREPSYFALAVGNFIILSFCMAHLKKSTQGSAALLRKYYLWSALATVLGLLSGSFSILLVLSGVVAFIFLFRQYKDNTRYAFIIIIGVLAFVFTIFIFVVLSDWIITITSQSDSNYISRIGEAVRQLKNGIYGTYALGQDYSSEASRLIGVSETFKSFLSRPLFGLGIGTAYCVSGLVSILANIGFLGMLCWVNLVFFAYPATKKRILLLMLLIPVTLCNDLYTLYDTSYLLLLPLAEMAYEASISLKTIHA